MRLCKVRKTHKMHVRNMTYITVGNISLKTDNSYNLELAVYKINKQQSCHLKSNASFALRDGVFYIILRLRKLSFERISW